MSPEAMLDEALLGSLKANIHRISNKSLTRLCDAAGLTWSISLDREASEDAAARYSYWLEGDDISEFDEFRHYDAADRALRSKLIEVLEHRIKNDEVSASGLMAALLNAPVAA